MNYAITEGLLYLYGVLSEDQLKALMPDGLDADELLHCYCAVRGYDGFYREEKPAEGSPDRWLVSCAL